MSFRVQCALDMGNGAPVISLQRAERWVLLVVCNKGSVIKDGCQLDPELEVKYCIERVTCRIYDTGELKRKRRGSAVALVSR